MCVVILVLQEVRVVRGDDGQPQLVTQRQDLGVELRLAFAGMRLHFEVIPVLEQLGIPRGGLTRGVHAVVHEVTGHFTGQARRRDDQPLGVLGQQFAVDTWLRVEAFGVPQRRQLDQILVAHEIAG